MSLWSQFICRFKGHVPVEGERAIVVVTPLFGVPYHSRQFLTKANEVILGVDEKGSPKIVCRRCRRILQ